MQNGCSTTTVHKTGRAGLIVFFALLVSLAGCSLENSQRVPGDIGAFDPVKSFEKVRDYAEGGALVKLTAHSVRSDGTLDLNAGSAVRVEYSFLADWMEHGGDITSGAGPARSPLMSVRIDVRKPCWKWFAGSVWKRVSRDRGMLKRIQHNAQPLETADPPRCPFGLLWCRAVQMGASPDNVATIQYDATGYTFTIQGTRHIYFFSETCRLKK